MSIAEMQACLARLYVDEPFRKLFFRQPETTLLDYSMTADEREALKNIDKKMLDFFAMSLVNKRKEYIERAYPASFRLNSDMANLYYRRYYQVRTANPHEDIDQDVVQFGIFLEESMAGAADVPEYACHLARYERLCHWLNIAPQTNETPSQDTQSPQMDDLLVLRSGVLVESFSYDVATLCDELDKGGPVNGDIHPSPDDHCILFIPASGERNEGRMLRINYATSVLLQLCDGILDMSQIIAGVEETLGASELADALREPIDRLLLARAIEVVRT